MFSLENRLKSFNKVLLQQVSNSYHINFYVGQKKTFILTIELRLQITRSKKLCVVAETESFKRETNKLVVNFFQINK